MLNKIDLPGAESDRHAAEIAGIIGCDESEVLRVSAKTGEGVSDLLDTIVAKVPASEGVADAPARASFLTRSMTRIVVLSRMSASLTVLCATVRKSL